MEQLGVYQRWKAANASLVLIANSYDKRNTCNNGDHLRKGSVFSNLNVAIGRPSVLPVGS